jgi:hypothetical protein
LAGSAFDPAIQFPKVLIQNHACIQQRHQSIGQNVVHFDHRAHDAIKAAVLHCHGQANAKDLQQTTYLVGEIHRLLQERFAGTQQRMDEM